MRKLAIVGALLLSINAFMPSLVDAKVTDMLTKDKISGNMFSYDLSEVSSQALSKALGDASPLYDEYIKKDIVALYDDQKGYVDIKAIRSAAVDAALDKVQFNLSEFVNKSNDIVHPNGKIQKRIFKDGQVVDIDSDGSEDDLYVIDIQ